MNINEKLVYILDAKNSHKWSIAKIKALVVESWKEEEEEILEILNGRVRVGRGITEQLTAPIWTLRLYAKAIIAEMKEKWG